ncbi:MAG: alpha/beta fold hydrolase [Elusimicrobia bacterium]|nr:alpha/beta fold hydrolase [Elusimicrobiota bacterium]
MDDALLRKHYPFKSRFLDIAGHRLHYIDEGSGEPVVFVHGNPSWSFLYRGLVSALSPAYRCVALDHIGMGLSDKPGDDRYDYTLERRVADLDALLRHLSLTKGLTLVLHDWGGMIGMSYAVRHPERISRIVLANTAAFMMPPGGLLPWQLALARSALGALLVRGFNAFSAGAARFCVTKRPMSREVRSLYTAPYGSWAERIATLRFVEDIPMREGDRAWAFAKATQEGLGGLASVPKLVLWGERDFVFDAKFLSEWRRRCPEAEFHAFPESGHYIFEDEPEAAARLVKGFLAAHPAAAVR